LKAPTGFYLSVAANRKLRQHNRESYKNYSQNVSQNKNGPAVVADQNWKSPDASQANG